MRTLSRLITRMFLWRFALLLIGIAALVLSIDLFSNAEQILDTRNGNMWGLAEYALLRLPDILSEMFGIITLLAALITLLELSRHSELVAMWSAGASQFKIMWAMMPLAMVLGIISFLNNDHAVPAGLTSLYRWGIGEYGAPSRWGRENGVIWMRSGRDIIRVEEINDTSTELGRIMVFRRSDTGTLLSQITADKAIYSPQDKTWLMHNVRIRTPGNTRGAALESWTYSGNIRPAIVAPHTANPRAMPLIELAFFIDNKGLNIRPVYVYQTWAQKRFAVFFIPALMLLVAVPLAHRFKRTGGGTFMILSGIALGFTYFILNGITLTMGEAGIIPPWLAAWGALLAMGCIAGMVSMHYEKP